MSGNLKQTNETQEQDILKVRRQKLFELQSNKKDPFHTVRYDLSHRTKEIIDSFCELEGKTVKVAGRLMAKRGMGKSSFCDLHDRDGRLQLFFRINDLGEEAYEEFKKLDIGDIIGVSGQVFKTRMGEISIKVFEYVLLSKSLRPLPEKFHGLKDTDTRYRQRYLDLIVNPDIKKNFIIRSKIISAVRRFLDDQGFLEVDTPILNSIPGGAAARPFVTHHNTLDMDMYLRIAPELYLKRLIVGGMEKVYEMGRMFRNEGMSVKHNPEFTLLEVYEAYAGYKEMMILTEGLFTYISRNVFGTVKITYQGEVIDLTPPWTRMTMIEAVRKYTGIDFDVIPSQKEAVQEAEKKGVEITGSPSKGEVLNLLFERFVEGNLVQPTLILDYPVEVSPLTKRKPDHPELTERFELFIAGREMANAYSELNDPIDQKERFLEQVKKREQGDEEANMMDEDYIVALEHGLPPTGGLGVGIDRLIMLFTDSHSIRDILLFPTMKPKE